LRVEPLQVELSALRIDGRNDRSTPALRLRNGGGQDFERADADHGFPGGEPKRASSGKPHTDAGEGPRPNGHGDPVEGRVGDAGFGHEALDHGHQRFRLALIHRLAHTGDGRAVLHKRDRAGGGRGIESKQKHEGFERKAEGGNDIRYIGAIIIVEIVP
jgi:hypothetical protein